MNMDISLKVYLVLSFYCLDKNNKRVKKKIDLGMIGVKKGQNLKSSLIEYANSKAFQRTIWKSIGLYYEPSGIEIHFVKPKLSGCGLMIPSDKSFLKLSFKI